MSIELKGMTVIKNVYNVEEFMMLISIYVQSLGVHACGIRLMTVVFPCMHVVICAMLLYSFPVLFEYIMCMHSLCSSVVVQCIVLFSFITQIANATW